MVQPPVIGGDRGVWGQKLLDWIQDITGDAVSQSEMDALEATVSGNIAAIDAVEDDVATLNVVADRADTRVFDVRKYGATGDGDTNDTAAFTAALAAMSPGDVLYIPKSTYRVNSGGAYQGAINVTQAGITILAERGAIIKPVAGPQVGIRMISIAADDVVIDGLTFESVTATDLTETYLANCNRVTIRNCKFIDPASGGVHIVGGVFDLIVANNIFVGDGYGVLAGDPATGGRWSFTSNNFRGADTGADGIELNCPTTGISDVVIANNVVSNYTGGTQDSGFGIAVAQAKLVMIAGNHVSHCRVGIHLEDFASECSVTGNVAHSCTNAGIELQAITNEEGAKYSDNVTISGNTVYNNCLGAPIVSPPQGYGGIEVGQGAIHRGVVINSNICFSNNAAGIFAYEARDSVIVGNVCRDNVGAGIWAHNPIGSVIMANRCFDTQDPKTQTAGIKGGGSAAGAMVAYNMVADNLTRSINYDDWAANQPVMFNNIGDSATEMFPIHTSGWGDPEGVMTAVIGSTYARKDGGASTSLYVKTSGDGNTGWTAK